MQRHSSSYESFRNQNLQPRMTADTETIQPQEIRQTHSDTDTRKKKSGASKHRRKISKNAKKFVKNLNYGFRLTRENSALISRGNGNSLTLTGELYKKRQGITGFQAKVKARLTNEEFLKKVWPVRYVELRNGVLSYYKIKVSNGEKVVTQDPRGSIDLKQKGLSLRVVYPQSEASELLPTMLHFELVYNNILKPTEWITYTFCCQSQDQFFTWVMALSHEIVNRDVKTNETDHIITRNKKSNSITSETFSVGSDAVLEKQRTRSNIPVIDLNRLIVEPLSKVNKEDISLPSPIAFDDESRATETERDSEDQDVASVVSKMSSILSSRIRKRRFPMSRKRKVDFNRNLHKLDIEIRESSSDSLSKKDFGKKVSYQSSELHKKRIFYDMAMQLLLLQVLMLLFAYRSISFDLHILSSSLFTFLIISSLHASLGFGQPFLVTLFDQAKPRVLTNLENETNSIPLPKCNNPKSGKVEVKDAAQNDLETLDLKDKESFNPFSFDFLNGFNHLDKNESKGVTQTWRYSDHRLILLRKGPNYKSTKIKAPTKSSFFVPVGLHPFVSPNNKLVSNVMKGFKFPFERVNPTCKDIPKKWKNVVPDLLVVNYHLPGYSPMFKTGSGEPGYELIQFFSPSDDLIHSLINEDQQDNATKNMLNWLSQAETNQKVKHKLKVLVYARNLAEVGVPKWVSKFNGKPTMVTKSCKMHRGSAFDTISGREMYYLELNIDVSSWSMMVRRGIRLSNFFFHSLCLVVPNFLKKCHWSVTLAIQGDVDDELPERALNLMEIYKCDIKDLEVWPFNNE